MWTSYLLRAANDDTLSELPLQLDQIVHRVLASELEDAQIAGFLRPDVDSHVLSNAILGLVDGIALRMLYTPLAGHDALLASLDAGLHAMLSNQDAGTDVK